MKIGLLAVLIAIGVVVGRNADDVKRYLKMRKM
jgi:hypothetical protein